jgi:sodium/potassium/calcium exchanger 6
LSQGVTLLAFGNGCPDIFSSLAAASSGRPELIVGELMGAGVFCTSIVAGLIFISADFKIARRPLLRDTSFYLLAAFLIWLYCLEGRVTFYGALG